MRFTGCALPSLPSSCGSSAATFPTTTVCACIQGSATLHPLPMKRERRDRTTCLRNRGKILPLGPSPLVADRHAANGEGEVYAHQRMNPVGATIASRKRLIEWHRDLGKR